jgi:Na+-transporting NADH:ubiquinone oxidoreductase subunit NqrC
MRVADEPGFTYFSVINGATFFLINGSGKTLALGKKYSNNIWRTLNFRMQELLSRDRLGGSDIRALRVIGGDGDDDAGGGVDARPGTTLTVSTTLFSSLILHVSDTLWIGGSTVLRMAG